MDLPADGSTAAGAPPPTHRRPPPLPHHLQTSGIGWLVAAVVLVALTIAVFARGLQGPPVAAGRSAGARPVAFVQAWAA